MKMYIIQYRNDNLSLSMLRETKQTYTLIMSLVTNLSAHEIRSLLIVHLILVHDYYYLKIISLFIVLFEYLNSVSV